MQVRLFVSTQRIFLTFYYNLDVFLGTRRTQFHFRKEFQNHSSWKAEYYWYWLFIEELIIPFPSFNYRMLNEQQRKGVAFEYSFDAFWLCSSSMVNLNWAFTNRTRTFLEVYTKMQPKKKNWSNQWIEISDKTLMANWVNSQLNWVRRVIVRFIKYAKQLESLLDLSWF